MILGSPIILFNSLHLDHIPPGEEVILYGGLSSEPSPHPHRCRVSSILLLYLSTPYLHILLYLHTTILSNLPVLPLSFVLTTLVILFLRLLYTVIMSKTGEKPTKRQSQSPSVKTQTVSKANGSRSSSSQSQKGTEEELTVVSDIPLPALTTAHRDLTKCPCGKSNKSCWMVDCSQCNQQWHSDCLSFKGIKRDSIDRMLEYLCPFCYKAPVPTAPHCDVDLCHICRNTVVLQKANNEYERVIASENSQKFDGMFEKLSALNDDISAKINKLEQLMAETPSLPNTGGFFHMI